MASSLRNFDRSDEARILKGVLPDGVQLFIAEPHHAHAKLHPLEQEFVNARRMQPVREREFRVGRSLAREALAQIGIADHALLPADTREPLWPAGIVGSISHCDGACAVAIAESSRFSGLGIDLERIDRIDAAIAGTVCTPDERRQLDAMNPRSRRTHLALLFSAKESVFKALFPLTRQFLEFEDIGLVIADGRFIARAVRPDVQKAEFLNGRFAAGSQFIATAAWLPAV